MWESPPERPPNSCTLQLPHGHHCRLDHLLRCPVPAFHRDCRCSVNDGMNIHTSLKNVHLCQAGNSLDHLHVWRMYGIMLPWVVSLMLSISSTEAVETIHENPVSGQLNSFLNKSLFLLGLWGKDGRKSLPMLLWLKPRLHSSSAWYLQGPVSKI